MEFPLNTITIRRFYLIWRTDIAAGLFCVGFMVAGFWAAGHIAALLKAVRL